MKQRTRLLLKTLEQQGMTPEEQFRIALLHDIHVRYTSIQRRSKQPKRNTRTVSLKYCSSYGKGVLNG